MADIFVSGMCGTVEYTGCGVCGGSQNYFYSCRENLNMIENGFYVPCDHCTRDDYVCLDCIKNVIKEIELDKKEINSVNIPSNKTQTNTAGRTSIFSQDKNSSINQYLEKTGLPNNVIYGIGAGAIVIILIILVLIFRCMRKPKNSNSGNKFGGERSYNDTQGYDQLNDDNYSNYRTLSNPNLHKPVDNNPFAQVPSVEDLPNYDSILIEDPNRNIISNNNNNNNSNSNSNSNINNNNNNRMYNNEKASNSQSNLIMKNTNVGHNEGYSNNNGQMSSELHYGSPNHSQTNIDVMPMSATVTTTEVMNKNGVMSPKYKNNRPPHMSFNSYEENMSPVVNANNNVYNETDTKQSYNNMTYSPSVQGNKYYQGVNSPSISSKVNAQNGNLYVYTNQAQTQSQSQSQSQNQNQNPLINPTINPAVNPFSDSHATRTPTNGYPPTDLSLNSIDQNSKEVNDVINQNFANISINHSFNNNNNNSPMTPKSIASLKSPSSKHQSLVTSPNHKNMNMNIKRATISSPTHESFMSPMAMEAINSSTIRSPATPKTPKTPKSSFTPNLSGTPNINESRNSIRVNSPSVIRPSTPNHHTPNLERMPSSRSTTVSVSSNTASPNLERKASGKSQHSITTATPVMENIPSASGKQTLERHHSGKSIKSNYATATLERVPSSGQKQVRKHTQNAQNAHNRNPSLDNSSTVGSTTGTGSVVGSNNGSEFLSTNVEGKNSSLLKSPMTAQKSPQPQPKSILKNANVPNNTTSNMSQEELNNISKSHSIKRKKSKPRKQPSGSTNEINVPPFPSMSRKASGVMRENSTNTASPYSENVPTTPLRPPQLTVFGHAVATPPTPKSTRFPQDAKVLPPTERAPMPPDILGGTDVVPLNTMTLQRKHFHKKNKSVSGNIAKEYDFEVKDDSAIKSNKAFGGDHPLPVPPPHHYPSNKSAENLSASNKTLERERMGRSQDQSDSHHFRSKSLPRPNKYGNGASRYAEENALYNSVANSAFIYNLEQKLTSFEVEFYKENENQKVTKSRSKNSVISILHEEKRNMDYYLTYCDD